MPQIDLSDIVLDPFIAGEAFSVIRRQQAVDNNGIMSTVNTAVPNVRGQVTPTGDNSLVREEAFQTQSKSISVITSYRLRGASKDENGVQWQPDLVLWKGDYYIVREIKDWSQYGAGLIEADCTSIDFVDQPPT